MILPAEISHITPAALNRLFEETAAGLQTVTQVRATPLDGGYGYLSSLFRLSLKWSGEAAANAPETLIAKLPLQARLDAVTPDAVRMFRREAMFHRVVAPNAPIRTAEAWVAEFDEESGAATMVFEDLGKLASFGDRDTVSVERVENALTGLAALHAKYWQSDELEKMAWLAHPAASGVDQVSTERFAALWPRMVESGACELSPTQLRLGELLCTKLDGVYEALHAGPKTLIHADLHQENLFFGGDDPTFIDWALSEWANPAKDIAKLTASCLKPGTVSKEQPRLIRRYWDALGLSDSTPAQDQNEEIGAIVIPTEAEGSDRSRSLSREILNQVQNDHLAGAPLAAPGRPSRPTTPADSSITLEHLERDIHLATCHYLAMMSFLSDRDFAGLASNMETRTDFTSSRVIAACDREEIVAAVEEL